MKIKDILTICHGKDYKSLNIGKIPVLGTGGIITYVNKYLCNWDCVLIGRKGTINKPQYMSEPFWCVDTLFYSKPKENNYPKFQFYLFETIDWNKNNEASGIPSLSASTIGNLKVKIPSLNEQIKISTFLSKIDERIETQSKIIKEYKSLKKEIINQLIFKNPKLNQRIKLADFATLKNGYAFKSSSYCENGIFNILTISNVQGDGYIDLSNCNKIVKIPEDIQQYQILKCNDILISLTGNVGRVSIVNVQNCLLNQRVGVLIFKNDKIKKYVYHAISSIQFEKKMTLKGQGAAQKNIGNDDVESFKIPFSNDYNYLDKLVNLLELLDEKIAIETSIINDYLSQKKYLLANMFI